MGKVPMNVFKNALFPSIYNFFLYKSLNLNTERIYQHLRQQASWLLQDDIIIRLKRRPEDENF